MELYQGIVLGIIQGLTEFLPVSSSGHLVLGQALFGLKEAQLAFDISVHMGTLLAVLAVYAKDIGAIISSMAGLLSKVLRLTPVHETLRTDKNLHLAGFILAATIPTGGIGLVLKQFEHILFSSTLIVGIMLLLTGSILWGSRRFYSVEKQTAVGLKNAVIIGISQGLAVLPGISRSGTTIATGMFLGLDRHTAAKFSFLMSIPAIVGAEILSVRDLFEQGLVIDQATIYATMAAFISGLIALKLLLRIVHAGRFHLFAPYCWILGLIVLALTFF